MAPFYLKSLFILSLTLLCIGTTYGQTSSFEYINTTLSGKKIRYISVPQSSDYEVVASVSNTGSTLLSLIEGVGGIAGINGAYFIPKDYTKLPDTTNAPRIFWGDMKSYSKYAPDTGVNVLFGWDKNNKSIVSQNNIWSEKRLRQNYNSRSISRMQSGIGNFPTLLINGVDTLPLYQDTWLITKKMSGRSNKTFICFTDTWDTRMGMVSDITLADMPAYLLKLWCYHALNLDNGGSSALYSNGKYQIGPGRNIMDGYVVRKKVK